MNGWLLVTSAETNRVGSISQREPVGVLGSGIGRNALGNTNALIAAFTGDRSDSKCGLNPGRSSRCP
ncbi:monoacyl phosphatidylinositol tetramannoside-binding protein LpqW [Mycobacterium tuberculosis]|nr:monoacyl phosphatidylinositol tetramannoside-binding protein LpqW [Mycobacterium tuberculosis]